MKKFLLFFSMLILSVAPMMAQEDNDGWKTATTFNWTSGNEHAANSTVWYAVELTGNVPESENVLLYLNNIDESKTSASVEVTVYAPVSKVIAGTTYTSVTKLEGPTDKSIAAEKNYAMEIGGSVIKNFNLTTVYIKLKSDKKVKFAAEPVEPGEKDLDCLNATQLSLPTTRSYTNLNKASWYKLDLTDVKADATKTIEVTIKNTSSKTATLVAGVSFDCPSTGLTEETTTLNPGQTKVKKLDRKYLEMLAGNEIYLSIVADAAMSISAKEVVNTTPVVTYTVDGTVIALDTAKTYTQEAGTSQWYSLDPNKVGEKRQLPEIVVENLGTGAAKVEGIVAYEKTYTAYLERSFSIEKGGIKVQDIERNVVDNAKKMVADKDGVVYVKITTNQKISFIARSKALNEGTACQQAKDFDWAATGNKQAGNTTVWYAIDITKAKAASPSQDIELTVANKTSKAATVSVQVAFDCPYTSTTDATRTIAANSSKTTTIKNSMYSHLAGDVIWVGMTTDQNIEFSAKLVDAETGTLDNACTSATWFDTEGEGTQITLVKGGVTVPQDTVWYYLLTDSVMKNGQVPEVHVVNKGTATANVRVDVALDCPCVIENLQGRNITIGTADPYVKTPNMDVISSTDADTVWVRVITDQPLNIFTEMVFEDEGANCAKATEFNWTVGETYTPDEPHWYAVNIKAAKDDQKNIKITIENTANTEAKIKAEIAFDCPVTSTTAYNYTAPAKSTRTKELTYSMFETVSSDVVYIKLTADQKLNISADTVADNSPVIDICAKSPIAYNWDGGNTLLLADHALTDTVWYYLPLDTFKANNYELVPKGTINNLGSSKVDLTGYVAFKCQVKSPMSKTLSIAAGDTYTKNAERDMMQSLESDTIYFGVIANQDIHFEIELFNPDKGQDCLHAVSFDWKNGNDHAAADTIWYDIDLTYIKSRKDSSALIGIKNTDGFTGLVIADLFFTCDDAEPFASYSYNLRANDDKQYELGRELFTNMAVDDIYIRLYAQQDAHLYAKTYETEKVDSIYACQSAVPVTYNVDIEQKTDSMWYLVDLQDIRMNTSGDAVLTIKNISTDSVHMTAALSYSCPVVEKMLDKSVALASGETYEKTATRTTILNTAADTAWILVVADKNITFRLDLVDPRGESCTKPIDFDWDNGNLHPKDSTFWYNVDLKPVLEDTIQQRDIRLVIENLGYPGTTLGCSAWIYGDCPAVGENDDNASSLLYKNDYSFADSIKSKVIGRDFILSSNLEYLKIKYKSDYNSHLYVEFIPKEIVEPDTTNLYDTICPGLSTYVPAGWSTPILVMNDTTLFDAAVDSFSVKYNETQMRDSIVLHHVTLRKLPETVKIEDTPSIQPTATAGKAIDASAVTTALYGIYEPVATTGFMKIDTILWYYSTDPTTVAYKEVDATLLPTRVNNEKFQNIWMYYEVKYIDNCTELHNVSDTVRIDLADPIYVEEPIKDTVCSGFDFTSRLGYIYTVDATYTTVYDTVEFAFSADELRDSVYIYEYTLKTIPTKQTVTTMPVLACGSNIELAAATAALETAFAPTGTLASVDTIKWEYKDANGNWDDLTEDILFSRKTQQVVVRYKALTECVGKEVESDEITVNVTGTCIEESTTWTDTVCSGDPVQLRYSTVALTADMVGQTDTVEYVYTDAAGKQFNADSVYTYNYYVYLPLTLPELTDLDSTEIPEAICNEAVDFSTLVTKLQGIFTADELNAPNAQVVWEGKNVNGEWKNLETETFVIDPAQDDIDIRYTVTTLCDTIGQTVNMTLNVKKHTSADMPDTYKTYKAVSRYYGWLLMVDEKSLLADYPDIDSTQVVWYKVNGQNDVDYPDDAAVNPDTELGFGWYYTEGRQLDAGEYYARIAIAESEVDPCGVVLFSDVVPVSNTSAAPQLAPSVLAPRETAYVSGLLEDETYIVKIFDLMGNLVEQFTVTENTSFSFEAQDDAGYYMMSISSESVNETLKYIVK